ncbi:MAG: hypothetical protein OXD32_07075, partial [Endozoicomonadaceae bacterium]|nr:hypothetical protein [Endozoicomonadaceae bacterium]
PEHGWSRSVSGDPARGASKSPVREIRTPGSVGVGTANGQFLLPDIKKLPGLFIPDQIFMYTEYAIPAGMTQLFSVISVR